MPRDLGAYSRFQVFLNYPFDENFASMAEALSFAVTAAGLIPVCAHDLSVPDKPRLDSLVEAISFCHYSAHDFSRFTGEGESNLARMNMPIEMGMAVFHALQTQRRDHRCTFFVPTPYDYTAFASDLSGLDPKCHNNDPERLLIEMYAWLRDVVPSSIFSSQPSMEVVAAFNVFRAWQEQLNGSGPRGSASHLESREIIYQLCTERSWWDWRDNKAGKQEFPEIPLLWKETDPR